MSTHRTPLHPPKLGAAILHRLADRNEALAGDILEGFRIKQSRLWFWRELLCAILTGAFRRSISKSGRSNVEFPSAAPIHEDFAAKTPPPPDSRPQRQSGQRHQRLDHRHAHRTDLGARTSAVDHARDGHGRWHRNRHWPRHLSPPAHDKAWRGPHNRRVVQPSRAEVRREKPSEFAKPAA